MNWYYIFIGAACLQGLFLAFTLKNVSNNKLSLTWLSALLIVLSVGLLGRIFYDDSLFPKYPKIAIASDLVLFVYGPLVFLYVKTIFFNDPIIFRKVFFHFIPSFMHLAWICQFFFVSNTEIPHLLSTKTHQVAGVLTEILGWVHISLYLILAFRIMRKYHGPAKHFVSNLPLLHFLNYFFILNILALVTWAIGFFFLKFTASPDPAFFTYNSIWLLLSFSVYITGYYAIAFPKVFRIDPDGSAGTIKTEKEFPYEMEVDKNPILDYLEHSNQKNILEKVNEQASVISPLVAIDFKEFKKNAVIVTEKLSFTDGQVTDFAKKLELFMEKEEPYLDPNLTLPLLSGKLACTVHLLSKVINQCFGKNFFDYINEYRVKYYLHLVQKPTNKKYTILAMALKSGFNSKSTFNHSFKKITGKTPSQFIKDISNKEI